MDEIKTDLLSIVGFQLFGGERPAVTANAADILKEAREQTVFSTVFPFIQNGSTHGDPESLAAAQEEFFRNAIINANNLQEHGELHEIMTENGIPYVVIKGLSSAYYYPDPSLRDMGDVDFLVSERDFERATQAVLGAGFTIDHGDEEDSIHTAFKREPMSVWEQHRSVNGIPGGEIGELIKRENGSAVKCARQIELDGVKCMIPQEYHHGLIILLHMISHLTSEGIGLRHLCDWAVFVDRLGDKGFTGAFESELKSFGIWKFAQIMTAVSERYLGMRHMSWTDELNTDDGFLGGVIEDILSGGNFGKKDLNRYREIKYISNRGEGTVDGKNVFAQIIGTLNEKVYAEHKFIRRHRALLPAGWIAEGGKYIGLLATGRRKNKGTAEMLREASKRKDIYSQMELFKKI